jgi:hypothetical protein
LHLWLLLRVKQRIAGPSSVAPPDRRRLIEATLRAVIRTRSSSNTTIVSSSGASNGSHSRSGPELERVDAL